MFQNEEQFKSVFTPRLNGCITVPNSDPKEYPCLALVGGIHENHYGADFHEITYWYEGDYGSHRRRLSSNKKSDRRIRARSGYRIV